LAAALFAVSPVDLGGIVVRCKPGPARDLWFHLVKKLLPRDTVTRKLPAHTSDDRLFGGLDLTATLRAGRPIAEKGILASIDQGILMIPMAESLTPSLVGRLCAVIDQREVRVERDGFTLRHQAEFGFIAFDESEDGESSVSPALLDRAAFHIDLSAIRVPEQNVVESDHDLSMARRRLPEITLSEGTIDALSAAAHQFGIASLRAPLMAVSAARALAVLDDRSVTDEDDLASAAALVLAPRATRLPMPSEQDDEASPPTEEPPQSHNDNEPPAEQEHSPDQQADNQEREPSEIDLDDLAETLVAAALAAIPPDLLAQLTAGASPPAASSSNTTGAGQAQRSKTRGRPIGSQPGDPRSGARISLIDTLRAAAPWQTLRRRQSTDDDDTKKQIQVRSEDLRVRRYKEQAESVTIFAVDASGSLALTRLAEAKGAVELLLADCYVRRDQVAMIAFRGTTAELLLPPTRSLVRAKRALAGLPGGGGTPISAGLEEATKLGLDMRRRGKSPLIVLLTDGRANIARDGSLDRERARSDMLETAKQMRHLGLSTLVIDVSPRPQDAAAQLAQALAAKYVALPRAQAEALSEAVRSAAENKS